MTIRFACSNGHLLQAKDRYAGRIAKCPRCGKSVRVPQPQRRSGVTDTQALRLVGSYTPHSSVVSSGMTMETAGPSERTCPRCKATVATTYRICPHCQVYLGGLEGS